MPGAINPSLPPSLEQEPLSDLVNAPHSFLTPTSNLHTSLLELAKLYLDPLASDVTAAQLRRRDEQRAARKNARKRKRSAEELEGEEELLRMKRVHVEGLEVPQVWEQVRRVLDAANWELEKAVRAENIENVEEDGTSERIEGGEKENDESSRLGEEVVDWEFEGEDVGEDEGFKGRMVDDGVGNESMSEDQGSDLGSLNMADEDTPDSEVSEAIDEVAEAFVKDKHGLNDGFFSIDQFNKQSQFLEQQDARGEPDGAESDEEDIDWEVDPLSDAAAAMPGLQTPHKSRGRLVQDEDMDEEDEEMDEEDDVDNEDEEDGPTFGNVDLDAPEGDSEDGHDLANAEDGDGAGDFSNTNNILYADFFEPPARSKGSSQKPKKPRKPQVVSLRQEDQVEDTMARVHRDLFDDDLSAEEDETTPNGTTPRQNQSTHEQQQAALRAQIRTLEAENLAPKPWTLTGEAVAPTRPLNSLLEEDLDFARTGKPIPAATASTHTEIETLIKLRIATLSFDELIRRRPTDLATGGTRRGRAPLPELSDQKPAQGLAEQYAEEVVDPGGGGARARALAAKQAEIARLWGKLAPRLDALCNWHYKPRPPAAGLEIRTDAPAVRMEEARPDGVGDGGVGESMLAPQEVYRVGGEGAKAGRDAGVVVTNGGAVVAREEMTREQKVRRRRREKERLRKAGTPVVTGNADGGRADGQAPKREARSAVLGQLKKGGVKVIGKKGELRDVEGKGWVQRDGGVKGVGSLRL